MLSLSALAQQPAYLTITNAVVGRGMMLGTGTYSERVLINLQAVPQVDWKFNHWEGVPADMASNNPVILETAIGLQPKAVFVEATGNGRFKGGQVSAWGDNSSVWYSAVPPDLGPVIKVSAGWTHSLALMADGTVRAWGDNSFSQRNPPAGLSNVVDIVASREWSFAVTATGRVVSWGNNAPRFDSINNAISVASENYSVLVLKSDGSVSGAGVGTSVAENVGIRDAVGIGGADNGGYVVHKNGSVSGFGILGQALDYLPTIGNVQQVEGGSLSTVVLFKDGHTVATTNCCNKDISLAASRLENIRQISVGGSWSDSRFLALDWGGIVWPVGTPTAYMPARVPGVVMASLGQNHALTLTTPNTNELVVLQSTAGPIFTRAGELLELRVATVNALLVQWLKDGQALKGQTNLTIKLSSGGLADAGSYQLLAQNENQAWLTPPVEVVVPVLPVITQQPTSPSIALGGTFEVTASATGTPAPTYQWTHNDQVLPGATNATLILTNVHWALMGEYRFTASNAFGSSTSSIASLEIPGADSSIWNGLVAWYPLDADAQDRACPGRKGDFFGKASIQTGGGALQINGIGDALVVTPFDGTNATVSAHFMWDGQQSVPGAESHMTLFCWRGAGRHLLILSRGGDDAYTPSPPHHSNYHFRPNVWHHFVVTQSGSDYMLYVDGVRLINVKDMFSNNDNPISVFGNIGRDDKNQPATGLIRDARIYNRALSPAEVAVLTEYEAAAPLNPVVIESPSAKTVVAGETLSLTASLSGYSVSFRWQKDGVSLTDEGRIHGSATTTLVVTGVVGGDAGVYRLVGTNVDGKAITAGAAVTVLIPPTITVAPQSVDVFDGDPLTLRVAANGSSSLTYQWFKDGVALDGQRGISLEINRSQQSDAGFYYVVVSNSVASVVSAKAEVTFIPGIHVFAGGIPIQGSFVANDKFSLELQYANADWLLFYTLDNSVPDFLSRPYTGRFDVTTAANLRVIAYAPDFSRYLTSGPLEIRFLQQQLIDWGTVPTLRFGDVALLTASAISGLPVVFSVISGPATVNGAQLRATGAGVVVLRASQAGSDVFAPASETRTLTINRASQTLVWPELLPRKFGDSSFAVAVTSTGGLPVTLSLDAGKAVVANGLVTLTGVGTVNLIATQAGDVNREPVSEVRTFTVGKAEQTISFPSPVSRAFSTDVFQLTAVSSSKLPVTIEVLSGPLEIAGGGLRATGVGSAVIRARQPGNENYEAAISAEGTLKITQGIQTLAFAEVGPKTFGDAPVTLKATSSAGLPVIFRVESGPGALVGDVLTLTGAGTVVVQATQSGLATYVAASASQSITVAKAAQSISFTFLAPVGYTTNAIGLTGTASSGLPVNYRLVSGSGKISGTSITLLGIGNISVAAEQYGDENYRGATSVTNSFAVSRGAQSITFEQIPDQLVPNQPIFLSAKSSAGLPVAYAVLSGPATINGNVLKILNGGQVTVRALNFGSPLYLAAQVEQSFIAGPMISYPPEVAQNGSFVLQVRAMAGTDVVLEASSDLSTWNLVQRFIGQGYGNPVGVSIKPNESDRLRFWRVRP